MTELLTCKLDGGGDPLDEQVAGATVVGAVVRDGHTSQPQLVRVPNLGKWWHIHFFIASVVCLNVYGSKRTLNSKMVDNF